MEQAVKMQKSQYDLFGDELGFDSVEQAGSQSQYAFNQ